MDYSKYNSQFNWRANSKVTSRLYPFKESVSEHFKYKVVGVLGVLIIHLFFLLIFLRIELSDFQEITSLNDSITIELKHTPKNYAEANPEVFSNKPDQNERYSFRDQQASDRSERSDGSNMPLLDGTENFTNKIISGNSLYNISLEEPPIFSGTYGNNPNLNKTNGSVKNNNLELQNELILVHEPAQIVSPFDPVSSKKGSDVFPRKSNNEGVDESLLIPLTYLDALVKTLDSDLVSEYGQQVRPKPMVRPKLSPKITIGPIVNTNSSANRFGKIALDSTFSEFGDYQLHLLTSLQINWYNLYKICDEPIESGYVVISFIIEADGTINKSLVEVIESTALHSLSSLICQNAIIDLSPFDPWTKDMEEVFGPSKKITITFYY